MFNWYTWFYSVFQVFNNFPDLLLFTSLVFPNDRWNLTALFFDNIQVFLNIGPLLKAENCCLASNKIPSTLQSVFKPVIYPINLCSFYWVSGLCYFDRSEHILYSFEVMLFKSVGLSSEYGSGFMSQVKFNSFQITINDVVTSRFSWCILSVSRFQPLMELFYILDTRESTRSNYCMMICLHNIMLWYCSQTFAHISTGSHWVVC